MLVEKEMQCNETTINHKTQRKCFSKAVPRLRWRQPRCQGPLSSYLEKVGREQTLGTRLRWRSFKTTQFYFYGQAYCLH